MIIPYLRDDLEIIRGNSRDDGAPAWLLYDAVRNKYFTLGLTAFKLIKKSVLAIPSPMKNDRIFSLFEFKSGSVLLDVT